MPYLPEAVESVRAQTFRDFELVVQDGASTDATLEYFGSLDGIPGLDVLSEADGGIGDAYARALRRCRGELVGSIDADNLLEPDALARVVAVFRERPELACLYGAVRTIDADGTVIGTFTPEPFDLVRVMSCELVPPFSTAYFSRRACGDELRVDERMTTCADYELWLRLGCLPIARTTDVLGSTRLSEASMSRRTEEYDVHCANKRAALRRYLDVQPRTALIDALQRRSEAGIWLWAAESVFNVEGRSERFERYVAAAADLVSDAPRLDAARALGREPPPSTTVLEKPPVRRAPWRLRH